MIILDCIIMVLLVTTIVYAIVLNKKLEVIHKNRAELEKFIGDFSASLFKAENNIESMKEMSKKIINSIIEPLNNAQTLRDELSFLIERGNIAADRLEESTRAVRAVKEVMGQSQNFDNTLLSQERAVSNDVGPAFQDMDADLILSLKDIR